MIIRNDNQDHIKSWLEISGIVNENNIDPKITWDLKTPAKVITNAVGVEQVRKLHEANQWIDLFCLVFAWVLFVGSWVLISRIDFGILTILLIIFQGLVLGNFFYTIRHDTLMHRQFGGSKVAYILGIIMSLPMLNTYTRFLRHEDHHLHVGYDLFEEHIAELDSVWKRWLGITGIGLILLYAGKLKPKESAKPNENWEIPVLVKKAGRIEGFLLFAWFVSIVTLAFFFPYNIILGYLIPAMIVVPALLSIKNAAQHSETDVDNSMHLSTNFRANLFFRIAYCCSLGDVHIVHHIFPRIPFWKTPKAAKLFRETIEKQNVPRRTMSSVLYGYYFKGKPYRTLWKK